MQSKTVVFNVLALVLAIAHGFGFGDFTASPEVPALAAGIIAVVNIWLRLRKLPPADEGFR